ncbi:MAG: Nudix family hydrolase [Zoogloea sp.]|nr:Nudix family hydrolase [Zoogloea sp.]
MNRKKVDVAAAVITRPDGSFLLGQRAEDTFYPGYWEFPGGKVEPGETPRQALVRELTEELGMQVDEAWPWLTREHLYEHAHVRLHFFEVPAWHGEIRDHVHSALSWERAGAVGVAPVLPANGPIMKALELPHRMGITHAGEIGEEAQLVALEAALAHGLKLVQVREPAFDAGRLAAFCREVVARAHAAGARVMLNADPGMAEAAGADGVHLSAARLAGLARRPDLEWVGTSCHTRDELEKAGALGLDYALLGSVQPTPSHPGREALGWKRFGELVSGLPLPVFALGGLGLGDMENARKAGAHGIAAIRSAWQR